jgi:hypothetical protein
MYELIIFEKFLLKFHIQKRILTAPSTPHGCLIHSSTKNGIFAYLTEKRNYYIFQEKTTFITVFKICSSVLYLV